MKKCMTINDRLDNYRSEMLGRDYNISDRSTANKIYSQMSYLTDILLGKAREDNKLVYRWNKRSDLFSKEVKVLNSMLIEASNSGYIRRNNAFDALNYVNDIVSEELSKNTWLKRKNRENGDDKERDAFDSKLVGELMVGYRLIKNVPKTFREANLNLQIIENNSYLNYKNNGLMRIEVNPGEDHNDLFLVEIKDNKSNGLVDKFDSGESITGIPFAERYCRIGSAMERKVLEADFQENERKKVHPFFYINERRTFWSNGHSEAAEKFIDELGPGIVDLLGEDGDKRDKQEEEKNRKDATNEIFEDVSWGQGSRYLNGLCYDGWGRVCASDFEPKVESDRVNILGVGNLESKNGSDRLALVLDRKEKKPISLITRVRRKCSEFASSLASVFF